MTSNDNTKMMLSDNFYSIEVGKYCDIRMFFYSFDQAGLNFCSSIVLMV